jgi:hypothetical protein
MAIKTLQLMYPRQVDDYRRITKKMLKEIVANSSGAHRYPVAVGHNKPMGYWGDDAEADGRLFNLRLTDDFKLLGDVELQPEIDKNYEAGKYVGWSLGIVPSKKLGTYIDHLALLGSVGAAFKDLEDVTGKTNFSVVDVQDNNATVVCFGETPAQNKTVWCVRSEQTKQEAFKDAPTGGKDTMSQELKDQIAAQKAEIEAFRAQKAELETFRAENAELRAQVEARIAMEKTNRVNEFTAVKESVLTAAKGKGLSEQVRDLLSSAIDAQSEAFASGLVKRDLFDALLQTFGELSPKVQPGEAGNEGADESSKPIKFSGKEAVNCLFGSQEVNHG